VASEQGHDLEDSSNEVEQQHCHVPTSNADGDDDETVKVLYVRQLSWLADEESRAKNAVGALPSPGKYDSLWV